MRKVLEPRRVPRSRVAKRSKYFEGWYVRLVDATRTPTRRDPGVFLAPGRTARTGIRAGTGRSDGPWLYVPYPMSEFTADPGTSPCRWDRTASPPVACDSTCLRWVCPAPSTSAGRWTHGPFPPRLPARWAGTHGCRSWSATTGLSHSATTSTESLYLDGAQLDFTGGKGYIGKGLGTGVPVRLCVDTSNHFDDPTVNLMASVAIIPWLRGQFRGCSWACGTVTPLHRFASYTGAKVQDLHASTTSMSGWASRGRDGGQLWRSRPRPGGAFLHAPIGRRCTNDGKPSRFDHRPAPDRRHRPRTSRHGHLRRPGGSTGPAQLIRMGAG